MVGPRCTRTGHEFADSESMARVRLTLPICAVC